LNAEQHPRVRKHPIVTLVGLETPMIAAPLFALAFASQLVVTVAEAVPAFDTAPSCRAAAQVAPEGFNACMKDEQDARTQLASQWQTFIASDRATCTQNETTGGSPSYVELLTCLQMARDARALPADKTEGSNR
jgi:hypothetical protein